MDHNSCFAKYHTRKITARIPRNSILLTSLIINFFIMLQLNIECNQGINEVEAVLPTTSLKDRFFGDKIYLITGYEMRIIYMILKISFPGYGFNFKLLLGKEYF